VLASFPEGLECILRIKAGKKRKNLRSAPRLNVKSVCLSVCVSVSVSVSVSEVSGDVEESEYVVC
jgi:hypothetical protein